MTLAVSTSCASAMTDAELALFRAALDDDWEASNVARRAVALERLDPALLRAAREAFFAREAAVEALRVAFDALPDLLRIELGKRFEKEWKERHAPPPPAAE